MREYLQIPNADDIRGNITLPDEIGGVHVTWKSSNPAVISDTDANGGLLKKGVVTRSPKEDVEVMLTAIPDTISDATPDGPCEPYEFKVTVKKAPEPLKDEDFAGYLFAHFIGEENEDGEQIYFSLSTDGLHFHDMNDLKPVLKSKVGECGVRDPYICRSKEGDRFFLIATDLSIYHRGGWHLNAQGYYDPSTTGSSNLVFWESKDLIHFSEPRLLPVAPKNAGMAWAPEMVYDETTGSYVIFFSSSIMNPETKMKAKPNTIFYVTTRDFVRFSETKILLDCQTDGMEGGRPREIIDTTILKVGDTYYAASKDGDNAEKNGGIRIHCTKTPFDPESWKKVLDLDELGLSVEKLDIPVLDNSQLEGPELFVYNRCDWADPNVPEYGLMMDRFMAGSGYLPLKTTDLTDAKNERGSWKILDSSEYSFDRLKKRHGTILNITQKEIEQWGRGFLTH